ncbi:NAD(P)H-hydrate dehydratase [Desulfobacula sp.]|uniref:NAD(P)H-hydrate dehydratase n=1 Tax=Desulfobacula sp. TaxID=2593537 RepID=UPI00261389FC|nr:NAD(P)H-hydrate dehydratase [Desulfobacula sp.]
MLAVVGTVPDPDFPLTIGKVDMVENRLRIDGRYVQVNRGTPALLGAMVNTLKVLGPKDITGFIAGDIGLGDGSRDLYQYLVENRSQIDFHTIVFHYLQPDVDWHNRILFMLNDLKKKPVLIADAGFMYAAKMSGQAQSYDLFTPDVGELSFLADETAPHPFYTRGFILHDDNKVPDLISRAYLHGNAAKNLLVKGATDYIADKSGVIFSVDNPIVEAMEAMGGTGDTITGIVTALAGTGIPISKAAKIAAKVNRVAGFNAKPTPATQVCEIISHIPRALEKVLKEYNVQ